MRKVIGVFDSGFGGLTVLRELMAQIPAADYLYFGDTARLPYGSKSAETVARYASLCARYLEEHGAEFMVIACNTASAQAFDAIKKALRVPAVGVVEAGAESAAAATRSKKVVVIGTEGTVRSHAYEKALKARGVEAHEKACPLFVPLVEEGWTDHPVTRQVVDIYLKDEFANGNSAADVLMLGCTHYPLLKPVLRAAVPANVRIVDSAESTAGQVAAQLKLDASEKRTPNVRFFVTDSVEKFQKLGEPFLGQPITNVTHVDVEEHHLATSK